MKICIVLLFLILIYFSTSHSQPAFTSYGEIKVSQSPADDSTPSIAVNNDGAVWVVWKNASQWFYPNLIFDGGNDSTINDGYSTISLDNEKWAKFELSSVSGDVQYPRKYTYKYAYNFGIFNQKQKIDSSATILDVIQRVDAGNGSFLIPYIYRAKAFVSLNFVVIKTNCFGESLNTDPAPSSKQLTVWNLSANSINKIINDDGYFLHDQKSFDLFGIPNSDISPPSSDIFLYYSREQKNPNATYPIQPIHYERRLKIFSVNGDSLSGTILMDSIEAKNTDLSERIIMGSRNDFYLFHRLVPSDSIVCEHFSLSGAILDIPRFIIHHIRTIQITSEPGILRLTDEGRQRLFDVDYSIYPLPKNNFLIVWTKVEDDSSTNVYAGLLDENMNWLGQPKRINSDTTGNHYSPSIALKGDTVYVAWIDTRNGESHVYMRRFKADQITDVKNEEAHPTQFAIQEIYPNPFRESTTIKFTLSQNWERVGVRVFDLLGRLVKTLFEGEAEAGEHTVQFNAEHLTNGVYQVVLQSGKNIERKNIVVMR